MRYRAKEKGTERKKEKEGGTGRKKEGVGERRGSGR